MSRISQAINTSIFADAKTGWALLALGVTAWDLFAGETLSSGFHRARGQRPLLTSLAWAYVTAHLFHLIPDQYDPLRRLQCLSPRCVRAS